MKTTISSGNTKFNVRVEISSRVKGKLTEWYGYGALEQPHDFNPARHQNVVLRLENNKTCEINIANYSPMNSEFSFTISKFN